MAGGKNGVVSTRQGSPARAAYAAADAPALPDDETATPERPLALAQVTPTLASRSLKDQVGFADSFLAMSRGSPTAAPALPHSTSGVPPSPSVTAAAAATGRHSA